MNIVEQLLSYEASDLVIRRSVFPMSLTKLNGQVFEFPIQALTTEQACMIQDSMLEVDSKTGKMHVVSYEAKVNTVIYGCPDIFRNKQLLEHFNCPSGRDLVSKLLTAGELDKLKDAIDQLSGYDADDMQTDIDETELKN